uniref:Uncharacterized protein n=1 Tax=Setaria viridis TaxID=4556 RepID=A0A4U6T3B0_SETVI|nr:hypothetical protein SEVIR_9G338700v2 [Setaria viridis]
MYFVSGMLICTFFLNIRISVSCRKLFSKAVLEGGMQICCGLGGFVACRALSQRNSDPTKASWP